MKSRPTARLLSTTAHPIETMYCMWKSSRDNGAVPDPAQLAEDRAIDASVNEEVLRTFEEIVASDIPVSENMDFVFLLEHVPVSLREQIVRHRIGHRFGENFGVDIVPGDVQDSWWSQSMRILDMGKFAADKAYFTPDTIDGRMVADLTGRSQTAKTVTALQLYEKFMAASEAVYQAFVEAGIPREDARQVIPLAATSRITWKMNYMSLKHILRRRTCWIAQLGMWEGIVHDMVNELAERIHPVFRTIAQPPCFRKNEFVGCPFPGDNLERIRGKDEIPPCPLFLTHHHSEALNVAVPDRVYHLSGRMPWGGWKWDAEDPVKRERFAKMQDAYERLWGRHPWTGEPNVNA